MLERPCRRAGGGWHGRGCACRVVYKSRKGGRSQVAQRWSGRVGGNSVFGGRVVRTARWRRYNKASGAASHRGARHSIGIAAWISSSMFISGLGATGGREGMPAHRPAGVVGAGQPLCNKHQLQQSSSGCPPTSLVLPALHNSCSSTRSTPQHSLFMVRTGPPPEWSKPALVSQGPGVAHKHAAQARPCCCLHTHPPTHAAVDFNEACAAAGVLALHVEDALGHMVQGGQQLARCVCTW